MPVEKGNARAAPGAQPGKQVRYQAKKHLHWPMRLIVAAMSVAGMLGLWQFVAHEPAASAQDTPSFRDAEQQLQLGGDNGGNFSSQGQLSAPNTVSGTS